MRLAYSRLPEIKLGARILCRRWCCLISPRYLKESVIRSQRVSLYSSLARPPADSSRTYLASALLGDDDDDNVTYRMLRAHHEGVGRNFSVTGEGSSRERVLRTGAGTELDMALAEGLGSSQNQNKWAALNLDFARLRHEADVATPPLDSPMRLIDNPEYANDIHLWATIINFRHRMEGTAGVFAVLEGLMRRRGLHVVYGEVARAFWRLVIQTAAQDDAQLRSIKTYAEWMNRRRGVRLYMLYETALSSLIAGGNLGRIQFWHPRLIWARPYEQSEEDAVASLLKRFIADSDPQVQAVLKGLYRTSKVRRLYDLLIPYLYANGTVGLAREWRTWLHKHADGPVSGIAQPLLRHLAGYYPPVSLYKKELLIASLSSSPSQDAHSVGSRDHDTDSTSVVIAPQANHMASFEAKDRFFAKWLATTWLPLDLIINGISALGLHHIGPMSLQAIALREGHAAGLLHRIEHLETRGISLGHSHYERAIRHFAKTGNDEDLKALLESDFHPDVFNDPTISQVLESTALAADWKRYRILATVQLANSLDLAPQFMNKALVAALTQGQRQRALKILDDMSAQGIQVFPSTSDAISHHILESVAPSETDTGNSIDMDFYVGTCYHMLKMRFPLATKAVQRVLYRLNHQRRFMVLEDLCLKIAQRYRDLQRTGKRKKMRIHISDTPTLFRDEAFQIIPQDMPVTHPYHPLQLIFDRELQSAIVSQTFRQPFFYLRYPAALGADSSCPEEFRFGRGLRLLSLLAERGVRVDLRSVRSRVVTHIAELQSAEKDPKRADKLRHAVPELGEIKNVCDEAWGSELLLSLPVLHAQVRRIHELRAFRRYERSTEHFSNMSKTLR